MKKLSLLLCGVIASMFLSGCGTLVSGYAQGGGYPRPLPGILFSEQSAGGVICYKMESMKDVEILGPVESQVSGTNVLMLFGEGDLSIKKAKELALAKYPTADDVVNVEIDMKHRGMLGLFNTVTMYYRGIAIKYKK
jgi:hypothetical protein